ncbi:type IV secretory system conjugative DNA transfer family protein [Bacteriovorax stolpii]|uniref:type IV secretory system conjugative DNA transfer family protein n=1 Tax=Bacteriovorax stolpii TaxID=960 RepID=UPI00163CFB4B|nr:type IV secretory system conjugative DNA transfer family protein [Bacteriovorax stolpii]
MSKTNETFSGDLFSPIITTFTECIQKIIEGGGKSMVEGLKKMKGLNFNPSVELFKVDMKMLSCEKKTLDESHLGWSINADRAYPLSYFDPGKNTFIIGASGWGKTNLINILQENCLRREQGIVFIDPKGSLEAINTFKRLCRHYGKEYRIFSEHDIESSNFNPIADMTNSQRLSTIMRSFDWGKNPNQYYYNESQKALMTVLNELSASDQEFDLHDIYLKLSAEHDKEETSGLLAQFKILLESDFGKLFRKGSADKPSITLKRAWEEKLCVYVGCSTQGYSTIARTVGKFFVSEAMNLSYWIGIKFDDSHKAMEKSFGLFIDEAGSVIFSDILDLANKCRASGINLYFAMQSYSDSEMIGGNEILMKQFFESFSNWFIQKQTSAENAEKLASACGTYVTEKTTNATDGGIESGRGTMREANEYLCHPDILKGMNVGQAILLEHGPKSLNLLNIRDARNSKAFKRPDEKEQEEVRNSPMVPVEKDGNTQKYGGL